MTPDPLLAPGRHDGGATPAGYLSLRDLELLEHLVRAAIGELARRNGADLREARAVLDKVRRIRASYAGDARILGQEPPELLTIPQAARRAGVPTSTVRDWLRRDAGLRPRGRFGERLLLAAEDVVDEARKRER